METFATVRIDVVVDAQPDEDAIDRLHVELELRSRGVVVLGTPEDGPPSYGAVLEVPLFKDEVLLTGVIRALARFEAAREAAGLVRGRVNLLEATEGAES